MTAKMIFPLQFTKQYKGPMDADVLFETNTELQAYLSNDLRYGGMLVTCKEHEGKLFILNNAETAWIEIAGVKGDTGFTPIPEITETAEGIFLNWIVGYNNPVVEGDPPVPVYKWVTPVNIKGKDGTNNTDTGPGHMDVDFTVKGVDIGMYADGQLIPKDTPILDVVKNILTKVENPVYIQPTLLMSTSQEMTVESGTTIAPELVIAFEKNDAGDLTGFRILEGLTELESDVAVVSPFVVPAHRIIDTVEQYKSEVDYGDGPVKFNNLGTDYPVGQISAGTKVSNTIAVRGVRKAFYGTDAASKAIYTTSEEIRNLNGLLNIVQGMNIEIAIPLGTQKVTFAYPETIRDVLSVKYVEGMNVEIKDIFVKTVVNVEGAEGGNGINYKVYTYVPVVPFQKDVNYVVTI